MATIKGARLPVMIAQSLPPPVAPNLPDRAPVLLSPLEMHSMAHFLSPSPRRWRGRTGLSKLQMVLGLALAAVVGLVAYGFMSRPDTKEVERPLTKLVSKGPFEHVVVEQGEIESSSNVEVRCEVKSRGMSGITILWVEAEGKLVEKGDPLVKLDSTALDQEQIQQQIACNTAEATSIQSQNTYEAAKIAKVEYLEATFKQEEQLVLSEVFVAEQNMRSAQLLYDSAVKLALRGIVTSLQLEGEQFAVDKARKDLEAANIKLNGLRKYTKEKMLKQLDSDIATAEAKWKADQKSYQLELAKLRDIEDQIAKCTIDAPRAGQVVYANKYSGGRSANAEFVVEAGAVVREQQPIVRLPDADAMQVKATINESRINSVANGMPVSIRVEALRDNLLEGEVVKVNQYAEPSGWGSTVKKYATFVKIKDPPPELRAGMNAEVRIYVERLPEAMQVPVQALAEHKEHFFCLVEQADGSLKTVKVERGPSNDKSMVILAGLKVGDHVVLDPRSREELKLPDDLPDPEPVAKVITPPMTTPVALKPEGGNAGERGGGAPKGKGRSGFSPAMLVNRTFDEYDTNKDNKLQATEIAAMPDESRNRMPGDADTNKDGDIDRVELTNSITQRMRAFQQGGPPGGGGPPSGGGQ